MNYVWISHVLRFTSKHCQKFSDISWDCGCEHSAANGTVSGMKRQPAGWTYLASFIVVGLALSILGPSLTYLRLRAGVSKGEIGILFAAQSLGYLLGALGSGKVYDRGLGHVALAGGLVGIAAAASVIPFVSSVGGLAVAFGCIGAFAGLVDVGGNVLVVWVSRGSGSSRLLNALHLFFGIGALLSPVLVNRSIAWSDGLGVAVAALGALALLFAVILLGHRSPTPQAHESAAPQTQTPRRILAVIGFFFLLYVGVEVGFSGWLKTYAEDIKLPGSDSPTWLNTTFWLAFTLGRLIAVGLAKRVRSGTMLVASCGLSTALMIVMIIADGDATAVWIATTAMGFAVAPQFATMLAYAEEHIALSGRSTSWIVSAAGVGGLALPYLIGKMLDRSGARAMPLAVGVTAAAVTAWLWVVRRELRRLRFGTAAS